MCIYWDEYLDVRQDIKILQGIMEKLYLDNQLVGAVFNRQLRILADEILVSDEKLAICFCENNESGIEVSEESLKLLCLQAVNEAKIIGQLIFFNGIIPDWTKMRELIFEKGVEICMANVEIKEVFRSVYTGGAKDIVRESDLKEWAKYCIEDIISIRTIRRQMKSEISKYYKEKSCKDEQGK